MAAALAYPLSLSPRGPEKSSSAGKSTGGLRLVEVHEEAQRRDRESISIELAPIRYLAPLLLPQVEEVVERVVHAGPRSRALIQQRRRMFRRRRLAVTTMATVGLLFGIWLVSGVLVAGRSSDFVRLPGSVPSGSGYIYTAHSGDTLWSIASRVDPSGDPRPVVAQLASELGGATLQTGNKLLIP